MILKGPQLLVTLWGNAPAKWGQGQAAVQFGQKGNASCKTQACAGGAPGLGGHKMPAPRRALSTSRATVDLGSRGRRS